MDLTRAALTGPTSSKVCVVVDFEQTTRTCFTLACDVNINNCLSVVLEDGSTFKYTTNKKQEQDKSKADFGRTKYIMIFEFIS
jgi:hypothetical protein